MREVRERAWEHVPEESGRRCGRWPGRGDVICPVARAGPAHNPRANRHNAAAGTHGLSLRGTEAGLLGLAKHRTIEGKRAQAGASGGERGEGLWNKGGTAPEGDGAAPEGTAQARWSDIWADL